MSEPALKQKPAKGQRAKGVAWGKRATRGAVKAAVRASRRGEAPDGEPSADVQAQLECLDQSLLRHIDSQSKRGDRASLLALHLASVQRHGHFSYLEIGSHLGGSLQALVQDARVLHITSIDLRPKETPDDRGKMIPYPGNSTARMVDLLRGIEGADVAKLFTIDASTSDIDPGIVPARPQLAFVDGEHTVGAAIRDARFCRAVMRDRGAVAFHDTDIVAPAIATFITELKDDGIPVVAYPLPDVVFVVEMGNIRLCDAEGMRRYVNGPENDLPRVARFLSCSAPKRSEARDLLVELYLAIAGTRNKADEERQQTARTVGKQLA